MGGRVHDEVSTIDMLLWGYSTRVSEQLKCNNWKYLDEIYIHRRNHRLYGHLDPLGLQ